MKINDYLSKKPKSFIMIIGLLLDLIIGFIDNVTGYQLGMSVFYLIPIGFVSWFINRPTGILMSIIAVATMMIANILAGERIQDFIIVGWNSLVHLIFFMIVSFLVCAVKSYLYEQNALILKLKRALDEVKALRGLLPICASCKKIRDDDGYWQQLDTYISEHTEANIIYGICPECKGKSHQKIVIHK
jgi:K+-sensing histidine kinase KdpD